MKKERAKAATEAVLQELTINNYIEALLAKGGMDIQHI